ncbi:MAG: non-ribosomal peptide synthetase, partial [Pseudonocardiaceae bacterium]
MTSTMIRELYLHEIFEWQAKETPDATAIICGERLLTYAELDRKSNQLARLLRDRGVAAGQFIAVYFDRSELPIIAVLACLKSGAAYVPIDPTYPGERIRHIASELGISACLTENGLAPNALQYFPDAQVVVFDAEAAEVSRCSDLPLGRAESDVSPADLAYVIYTSGTTGRPKGVMVEHQAVTKYVQAFNNVCGTSAVDRVYQGFSLSFDGSVEEIWMALSNGSALVVPTKEAPRFGDDLGRYLNAHGVTYFSTVPTMLSTLSEDVPSLRTVVLSGEVCPPELVNRWARPGRRLLNVYGPTEATVNTTVAECSPGVPVTIGRPLAGYGVHVVDEHLRPVPRGGKGELLISGPTLARGYVDQPQLTAERFLETTRVEGADRFYRTGDLVRWTEGGDLEFHGRLDTQVKIRGYRVEPGEAQAVLADHPGVREAVVVAHGEGSGAVRLVAYFVPAGNPVEGGELAGYCTELLPDYLVPSSFTALD